MRGEKTPEVKKRMNQVIINKHEIMSKVKFREGTDNVKTRELQNSYQILFQITCQRP